MIDISRPYMFLSSMCSRFIVIQPLGESGTVIRSDGYRGALVAIHTTGQIAPCKLYVPEDEWRNMLSRQVASSGELQFDGALTYRNQILSVSAHGKDCVEPCKRKSVTTVYSLIHTFRLVVSGLKGTNADETEAVFFHYNGTPQSLSIRAQIDDDTRVEAHIELEKVRLTLNPGVWL